MALSSDAIAEAALKMIDRRGLEALSMRRLGNVLGVEAMALYHHFPNRAALLDAIGERLVREIEVPEVRGNLVAWLGEVVRRYAALGVRHPEAFPLLANRRFNSPMAFAFVEKVLAPLIEAGASPELAADIFRGLGAFANGAVLAGIAVRSGQAKPTALDAARLPHVARAARWLGPDHADRQFEANLAMILDGVAQRLSAAGVASGRRRGSAKKGPVPLRERRR